MRMYMTTRTHAFVRSTKQWLKNRGGRVQSRISLQRQRVGRAEDSGIAFLRHPIWSWKEKSWNICLCWVWVVVCFWVAMFLRFAFYFVFWFCLGFPEILDFPRNSGFPGNPSFSRNPRFPGNLGFPRLFCYQGRYGYQIIILASTNVWRDPIYFNWARL